MPAKITHITVHFSGPFSGEETLSVRDGVAYFLHPRHTPAPPVPGVGRYVEAFCDWVDANQKAIEEAVGMPVRFPGE